VERWSRLFAYLLSFAVVLIFWMKHHIAFRYIKAYDRRLIMLNLLLPLIVSFTPFPTEVPSTQSNGVAFAFYWLVMTAGFVVTALIWVHATHANRLVEHDLDSQVRRVALVSSLLPAAIFGIAAALSMIDPRLGRLSLLLLFTRRSILRPAPDAGRHR